MEHKNNKLRPVVSCIQCPSYKIAKFVAKLLEPIASAFEFSINHSFELINHLEPLILLEDYVLISFDVVSLFTNVTHDLVVKYIEKTWEYSITIPDFPLKVILKSIAFLFDGSYF